MTLTRFEVFMRVMIQVNVFCTVMPCSVAVGYQHFEVSCCLNLHPKGLNLNHDSYLDISLMCVFVTRYQLYGWN
jgi:hypothetical protein